MSEATIAGVSYTLASVLASLAILAFLWRILKSRKVPEVPVEPPDPADYWKCGERLPPGWYDSNKAEDFHD